MSVRRLDALIVLLLGVNNLETKLLIELDGSVVVDLHMSKIITRIKKHDLKYFRNKPISWG